MPTLPTDPNLDHLRRQAKDLLRAAKSGDGDGRRRMQHVGEQLTLAVAQLALAREYGYQSWPRLKAEVETRRLDLAHKVEAFLEASVQDTTGRAKRLLEATPEIASYSVATGIVLGDAPRVRSELEHDPGLAIRVDPHTGWTALHLVSGSRWHRLDPSRASGLLSVARMLLDAGADPNVRTARRGFMTSLCCATGNASAGMSNEPLIRLLLDRGATVEDRDLYLAGFAKDGNGCLRLLLAHTPSIIDIARMALAAPISSRDAEGVRLLLEAGADPRRYQSDDGRPGSPIYDAILSGCSVEPIELLLANKADPKAPGPDGRSPFRLAISTGRDDLAELLRRYGANDDASAGDRLVSACMRGSRAAALEELASSPDLGDRMTELLREPVVRAAEEGNTAAVGLMLDLGFPIDEPAGKEGGTVLHAAAYAGSADTVPMLLARGANIEARDAKWADTALGWAAVGSGERPSRNPAADWLATVRTLLDAGASTAGITLSVDDPKAPSPEVAGLLRSYGAGSAPTG